MLTNSFFATVNYVTVKPLVSAQRLERLCSKYSLPILSHGCNNLQRLYPTALQPVQTRIDKGYKQFSFLRRTGNAQDSITELTSIGI